jgi:hypothetical protein
MYFGMGKTYHNSYHFPWFLQSLRNTTIISVYLSHQISALLDNPISQVNTIKYNKKNIFEMNFYKKNSAITCVVEHDGGSCTPSKVGYI